MPQEGRAGVAERLGDGGVRDPGLLGEGAERGPAGAVVEVVEPSDEVAVWTGRQVGARECAHRRPAAVAAMARESGTCSRASAAARLRNRAAMVPCPERSADCAARQRA